MTFGSTRPRRFLAVCGLVLLAASACAHLTVSSSARPVMPRSAPPTAATRSTATRSAVRHWLHGGGTAQMRAIAADFVAMAGVEHTQDWQLATSCYRLLVDVGSAQAYASIPEPSAQQLWVSALTAYANGAIECARGADAHDYPAVRKAAHEFDYGTASIQRLKARLDYLTH